MNKKKIGFVTVECIKTNKTNRLTDKFTNIVLEEA